MYIKTNNIEVAGIYEKKKLLVSTDLRIGSLMTPAQMAIERARVAKEVEDNNRAHA